MGADGSSDPDTDVDVDATEQDEQEANIVEDTAPEVAEAAPAVGGEADVMPAEISLERPGTKSPVTIPTSAMGMSSNLQPEAHTDINLCVGNLIKLRWEN